MNLKQILLLSFFLLQVQVVSQDLPKGMTPAEQEMMKNYRFPSSTEAFTTPPPFPVRTMAEWETLSSILITWTSYQSILRQIVDYAQEECLVVIVCSDSNSVKTYLTSGGVPIRNLKFIQAAFNSIWIRDYGPWAVYGGGVDSLVLVDWVYNRPRPSDDVISQVFSTWSGLPLYQTINEPFRLVATGGNFMTDGLGTAFSSKLIVNENTNKTDAQINAIMADYMGINRYVKMDVLPYDGIHHIDMHMKLLDEETLLVGQYPQGISDGPQIELNLQYVLNNFLTPFGRPYKVVRIPMPPDGSNQYPSQGGDYRTFTNSVFVNKTVIVPTYDLRYDSTALRIYREALPGYNVVGINCNSIIPASGAIHCITKEIGVVDQIHIVHDRLPFRKAEPGSGYQIKAYMKSKLPLVSKKLYYTLDTTAAWSQVPMQTVSGDTVAGYIPEVPTGTKIYYYIEAVTANRTSTKPVTAPANNFNFTADGSLPVELVSFDLFTQNGVVVLKWATASELNNREFVVERTVKGGSDWITAGSVPGKGTTTSPTEYSFTDRNPGTGVFSYRLRQIDHDGSFKIYNGGDVSVELFDFTLYQNYPNPFNPSTVIFYSMKEDGIANLAVYNALGERVVQLHDGPAGKGIHKVEFNALNMPAGVYFYRLNVMETGGGTGFTSVKKMILSK